MRSLTTHLQIHTYISWDTENYHLIGVIKKEKKKDCNLIKTSIFIYSITTTYNILLTLVDDKNDFNVIRLKFGIYFLKRDIG